MNTREKGRKQLYVSTESTWVSNMGADLQEFMVARVGHIRYIRNSKTSIGRHPDY